MNNQDIKDTGIIIALLERFRTQRLPRALEIKQRVDEGGLLDNSDLEFLNDVLQTASELKPMVDTHPDYQEIYTASVEIYHDITSKALSNEKAATKSL